MSKKPYEQLLENIQNYPNVTPKVKEGLEEFLQNEHPGDVLFTKWDFPPIIAKGKGSRVWDADGREYLDCITGMSSMNIGHGDERVAKAMYDQYVDELDNWFDFPTPQRLKLVKRLMDITPGDYRKRVRLALSGSDAVENAIRIARYYTKRSIVISFYGGYHGQNVATMGLTGAGGMTRWYNPALPADQGMEHFPYAYCYRCPYDKKECDCGMYCVKAIENYFESGASSLGNGNSGICNVAAMIVEPCQSSSGYIAPPKEFLVELRKLADKYGFLLIFDEIQTGMGRTGTMFCAEQSGVAPDMTLIGKALGAGIPMSAVVGRAEIFEDTAPGFICSTYAGTAISCTAANAVLDIFEEDKLVDNCAAMGEIVGKKLDELVAKHKLVGTYSRRGLFFGIELVKDRDTKEPAREETHYVVNAMRENGLLAQLNGYYANRISFIPPLNISEAEINELFEITDKAMSEAEKKYNY